MTFWDTAKRYVVAVAALTLVVAACGSDDGQPDVAASDTAVSGERPTVVVTTNILGDVVDQLIGDQANVVTIMPVGADPHDFQPSAQEVDQLLAADALIVNGNDFEEGLLDVIDSAGDAGVPTFEATEAVETIEFATGGDSHDDEDEHGDEHAHDGADPHFFTDPTRMADAVEGIGAFLNAEVDGLDVAEVQSAVSGYVGELEALDTEIAALVGAIPEERRVLVTNHEVFGYFADRYGFEVVGAVIPGGTTVESASAGDLAELAEIIEREGVPAIFADTSSSNELVETLAAEVGDVEVVELYSESLGDSGSDGATYLAMIRSNASRISAALA
jgi:zinc/manganese transport system substrate-binding protein